MVSTASRTIGMLRDNGWIAELVERYNPYSKKYNDLFGFADVLALKPRSGVLFIQVTTGGKVNARLEKIRSEAFEQAEHVILTIGARIEIHGWRKVKACTRCGEQRYGQDRSCFCDPKPGTRVKYVPIIREVSLNELYNMKNSDWDIVARHLLDVEKLVDSVDTDRWHLAVGFYGYPPRLHVRLGLKAGATDGAAIQLSKKERADAARVAERACRRALASGGELTLRKAPYRYTGGDRDYEVTFMIRPKNYKETADWLNQRDSDALAEGADSANYPEPGTHTVI